MRDAVMERREEDLQIKESCKIISSVYLFFNPLKETHISGNLRRRQSAAANRNEQRDRRKRDPLRDG